MVYGPADAYELMIENREYKQTLIAWMPRRKVIPPLHPDAQSQAADILSQASQYAIDRVRPRQCGQGSAVESSAGVHAGATPTPRRLLWLLYRTLDEVMPDATKVILGKRCPPAGTLAARRRG